LFGELETHIKQPAEDRRSLRMQRAEQKEASMRDLQSKQKE